uniref:Uncharacterized protein n=1 Tax=Pseudomonas aeruginosa TaxID=287 RepID=B3G2J7_PSEAI|nr:hypothetical protein PACL_0471 [Pseudomonas aeruginosa]
MAELLPLDLVLALLGQDWRSVVIPKLDPGADLHVAAFQGLPCEVDELLTEVRRIQELAQLDDLGSGHDVVGLPLDCGEPFAHRNMLIPERCLAYRLHFFIGHGERYVSRHAEHGKSAHVVILRTSRAAPGVLASVIWWWVTVRRRRRRVRRRVVVATRFRWACIRVATRRGEAGDRHRAGLRR